jgi:SAM-dependent methyltransferase
MHAMTLAFRPDEASPLVLSALPGPCPAGPPDLAIDARDEMLGFLVDVFEGDRERALFQYFRSGWSIADGMLQILRWRFGDPRRASKLLDFASGYGRVTRFLVREIPPERVWVADVYEEGVRFQEERFGVHGIVSTIRPEDFACGERFDAILVTSLFTHLPEERFVAWLRVLWSLLTPGGVLAFSTHSPQILPPGAEMPGDGILFEELSESGSLETSDYGSTWVTEEFVRSALARAAGSAPASLHRLDRGLNNFQDLYVAVPGAGVDFSRLDFRGDPLLFVEHCTLKENGRRLYLDGWAVSRAGSAETVEALLDGALLASAAITGPRDDVAAALEEERFVRSGWDCSFPLPAGASRSSSVLNLRVVDGQGTPHMLHASSVDAALLAAAQRKIGILAADLAQARERIADVEARAALAIEALEARLAAMEASRFWKMRNAWFRVKRFLGLTTEA